MDSSLDSVLSGQVETPQTAQTAEVEKATEVQQETQVEATGEQQTGSPPEAKQDDPLEKHRKGLEAAAAAERKRRQEAESRAEAAERRTRELEQQFQRPKPENGQAEKPKPTRAEFASEDDWVEAVLDWRDEQRALAWQKKQQEEEQTAKAIRAHGLFAEASKLEGFDVVAFGRIPLTDGACDAIEESDVAPQLMQFLVRHPEEAARITALSNARQIKELARLEDRLKATPKEGPEPREKPRLPETLTQARDARGRFEPAYSGPTPLSDIIR